MGEGQGMTFRSRALLDLARDQACVMCGRQDGTIVAAHSNLLEHGKGAGHKAHDGMHAWLCYVCHSDVDQGNSMSKQQKREFMLTAICRTVMELWNQELIEVKK
jgi:hypothetical protein